jgi:hypothetical protein
MYVTQTSIELNLIELYNQHSATTTWMNIDDCKNHEARDVAKTKR